METPAQKYSRLLALNQNYSRIDCGLPPAPLEGLVAWWEFNEAPGEDRLDSTLNSRDLSETSLPVAADSNSLTGTTSVRTSLNSALVDYDLEPYRIDTFYVSMWVYVSSSAPASGVPYIIGVWQTTGDNRSWALRYNYATEVFLLYVSDDGVFDTNNTLTTTTATMGRDQWTLVEFYFDSDTSELGVAVNNGSFETVTIGATSVYKGGVGSANVPFMIGGRPSDTVGGSFSGEEFDGLIDQVVMWDRVLTQSERDQIWNGGNGVSYNGNKVSSTEDLSKSLVGWWNFDEETAGDRSDISGNDNTLSETISSPLISSLSNVSGASLIPGPNAALQDNDRDKYRLNTFHVSMWVYVASGDRTTGFVAVTGVWNANAGSYRSWRLSYNYATDGIIFAVSPNGANSSPNTLSTFAGTTRDEWHLVEFYFDNNNSEIGIALDNSAFTVQSGTATSIYRGDVGSNYVPFMVGGQPGVTAGTTALNFSSRIDQLAMWGRILTQAERNKLWNNGRGIVTPNG